MPEKCGLDLTLHARFLRGAFFYTLLQTVVIMPVLMPLHIIYSPRDIAKTSMLRASVSSLVQSSGSKWLWVHALLIWWITITWTATVLWITWGALAYRRRQIKALAAKFAASKETKRTTTRGEEGQDSCSIVEDCKGVKRYRTLMVTNIPPDMRDETILRDYFNYYIQRHHARKQSPKNRPDLKKPRLSLNALELTGWTNEESDVEEVILVRKLHTIASLRDRRQDVLRKLEIRTMGVVPMISEKDKDQPLPPNATKQDRMQRLVRVLDPFLDDHGSAGKVDTTVWDIFPVSLLCALASLTNIAGFIKPLQAFLNAHPKVASAITSLAPVGYTQFGIREILEVFDGERRGVLCSYLTAFQNKSFDPLPIIASAFPTAAPYFASYILLQTAIQPFFEIFRFGAFGHSEAKVVTDGTLMSLVLGGAIMHLFMLLNPLVIPFMVWKRQFTYVYGRLYETNGKRTSIRVLRYSLDALALAQFVLFAFFILNKAKGHAIATGILFAITLITKLILDIQEADILCPPVTASTNDNDEDDDTASEDWDPDDVPLPNGLPASQGSSRFNTLRRSVGRWAGSWKKAGSSHKPIPFDHVLFSTLDSKIAFEPFGNPQEASVKPSEFPSRASQAKDSQRIVAPHPALQPWEDIPPYYRSRGYDDQPTYTDNYDDFLWLPRDPLSTLDLDDTVEMRVALTTSAGGSGQISDCESEFADLSVRDKKDRDTWQDVFVHGPSDDRPTSPGANSETRLMSTPSNIGSEVHDTFSGTHLFRRHTHKAATALSDVFRRPRASSSTSNPGIGMDNLSVRSRPGPPIPLELNNLDTFISMPRVSTPSAISVQQEPEATQEPSTPAAAPTGSHISFAATLGRSPSGRRPSRIRSGHSNMSEELIQSPTSPRNRSLSHLSPSKSRTASAMSAQQQRLWNEVMEEERLMMKEDRKEEKAEMEKEKEELLKEQDKIRKASDSGEGGGLRRRLTRGNSEGARPRLERAGESQRSRNGSVALVDTPTSIV
ncbi:hypothetical protein V865_007656 [Kwoniella europaea PYCC6329]|uniref:CSC1/OSCA1-like N-terminal transmembrane domain-containing protein n=1 Tax=Kwoniella europaea PYCC6329 TaxID=1423913 RepID=A0AAX4KTF3_9TREE